MKQFLLLFTFLLIGFQSFSQGTVRGVITNQEDGNGVPFAKIAIIGTELFAGTDFDGLFSIPNVPAGNYTVKVSLPQYEDYSKEIVVENDKIVELEIALKR